MKIKVKRMINKEFEQLKSRLGRHAVFVEVPGTIEDLKFNGVYTDLLKTTAAVNWPIDRPQEHQKEFADLYCGGGYPVDFFERKRSHNLKVFKGGK